MTSAAANAKQECQPREYFSQFIMRIIINVRPKDTQIFLLSSRANHGSLRAPQKYLCSLWPYIYNYHTDKLGKIFSGLTLLHIVSTAQVALATIMMRQTILPEK